jgi:acid phosphatase
MARNHGIRAGFAALLAAALAACATQPSSPAAGARASGRCPNGPIFAAGGERATLWVRNSSEFRAASETIYRAATAALAAGLADPAWTAEPTQAGVFASLPPAVVMDIDETVLDNSEPQAEMLLAGTCFEEFPATWDAWIAKRSAPAVPGAVDFIRAARAMKDPQGRSPRIFFITNRACAKRPGNDADCPQRDDTAANLVALGLGADALDEELMLNGGRPEWESEKLTRRQAIARAHRIVLNVGDDLADFLPGVRRQDVAGRDRARCAHDAYWGRRWFMIPNPMYGSWLVALGNDFGSALAAPPEVQAACERR